MFWSLYMTSTGSNPACCTSSGHDDQSRTKPCISIVYKDVFKLGCHHHKSTYVVLPQKSPWRIFRTHSKQLTRARMGDTTSTVWSRCLLSLFSSTSIRSWRRPFEVCQALSSLASHDSGRYTPCANTTTQPTTLRYMRNMVRSHYDQC